MTGEANSSSLFYSNYGIFHKSESAIHDFSQNIKGFTREVDNEISITGRLVKYSDVIINESSGILRITLNRPDVHNATTTVMVESISLQIDYLGLLGLLCINQPDFRSLIKDVTTLSIKYS